MTKIINLEEIQKNTKKFYEICSDISVLQREVEQMLTAIEKNAKDFEKGKISKDLFKYNDDRMKKESAKIIKKINGLVDSGVSLINKINKEIESQKTKTKERKRKKRIKEIKKKMKPKKKPVPKTPVPPAPPEQKTEGG